MGFYWSGSKQPTSRAVEITLVAEKEHPKTGMGNLHILDTVVLETAVPMKRRSLLETVWRNTNMNLQTRQHRRSELALLVITTVAMLTIMVTEITYIAECVS